MTRPDYQWALECWREMMAKYKSGRPRNPGPLPVDDRLRVAATALVRRSKDTDAITTVGYRYAIEPFLNALETALQAQPVVTSAQLIALLDDPRIASAVNEKGGGRGS